MFFEWWNNSKTLFTSPENHLDGFCADKLLWHYQGQCWIQTHDHRFHVGLSNAACTAKCSALNKWRLVSLMNQRGAWATKPDSYIGTVCVAHFWCHWFYGWNIAKAFYDHTLSLTQWCSRSLPDSPPDSGSEPYSPPDGNQHNMQGECRVISLT